MDDNANTLNEETRKLWDAKAPFWDALVGEDGNVFHTTMLAPATERLLGDIEGKRILEIACGNGVMSRHLARLGANVLATDFSDTFLDLAKSYETENNSRIEYRLADATDEVQLLALGETSSFDAAVCSMGIMDISDIQPMLHSLAKLLKSDAPFVFSVQHPCFNSNAMTMVAEVDSEMYTTYSIKLREYLDVPPGKGAGTANEPNPHYYFHRPLQELFGACFVEGFVLDGLEEPRTGGEPTGRETHLTWRHFTGIPPALVARMTSSKRGSRQVSGSLRR